MPAMEETFFDRQEGIRQFFRVWFPNRPPRAVVALVHGLGDHSGCFSRLADDFTAHGLAVFACDLYGNGRSDGLRGDAPSYVFLLNEADALLQRAHRHFPGLPVVLYGHSMGGGLVLNLSLRRDIPVRCVIATAPWLSMAHRPFLRAAAAGTVSLFAPRHRFDSGLNPSGLSHDPTFIQQYAQDPLVHGFVSARLFTQASRAGRWALHHAGQTRLPTLLVHGGADPITSCAVSRQYAAQSARVDFYEMEDDYHTLHNESDASALFACVRSWIEKHLSANAEPAGMQHG